MRRGMVMRAGAEQREQRGGQQSGEQAARAGLARAVSQDRRKNLRVSSQAISGFRDCSVEVLHRFEFAFFRGARAIIFEELLSAMSKNRQCGCRRGESPDRAQWKYCGT